MSTIMRLLTIVGLLGAIGIGGAVFLRGQSQPASAAMLSTATGQSKPVMRSHDRGKQLDTMAKLFGIAPTDLRKELQSRKPFYQIASEHGVTYSKLQEQHKTELKTKLDDMVKVGFMTRGEADNILNKFQDMPILEHDKPRGFGMMKMMD